MPITKENNQIVNGLTKHQSRWDYYSETLIHLFCFLSILFIGAEMFEIKFLGLSPSIEYIFLLILTLLLIIKNKYIITLNWWIVAFLGSCLISVIFSINFMRSLTYYCGILCVVFLIFYTFANYVRFYGLKKLVYFFRLASYLEFGLFILQYLLKLCYNYEFPFLPTYGEYMGIPRFRLWFFEPSFLATYLIIWLVISAYEFFINENHFCLIDLLMCGIMILLCTSTTGYIGFAITAGIIYLLWLIKKFRWYKILVLIPIIGVGILFSVLFKDVFDVFIGRIFRNGLDNASGGRISEWNDTVKVFFQYPLFGVGPGNYGNYFGKDTTTYVPTNIVLELLSTLGIFATIAYFGLTICLTIRSINVCKKHHNYETSLLVAFSLALLIMMIVLQINQGYLRMYHWFLYGILEGGTQKYLAKNRELKLNFFIKQKAIKN